MSEDLTLRVYAVEGRRVFASRPDGRALPVPRFLGCDESGAPTGEGELIPAVRNHTGLIPASAAYRNALAGGDLTLDAPRASGAAKKEPG